MTATASLQTARVVDAKSVAGTTYDVVIVGSGVAGSILAKELAAEHYRVLVIEAGPGRDMSQNGFQHYLENFYAATSKDNNAPFPPNPNADMPRGPDNRPLRPGQPNTDAYLVQNGPFVSDTVYSRVLGGTTVHWEGKTIRMLREDFTLRSRFGQGLDWPIGLDDLIPAYEKAEFELGVSGDVEAQKRIGVEFRDDYVYPMMELQPSYLDQVVAKGLRGMKVGLDGEEFALDTVTFPQAKNADPNPAYATWNGGRPYQPKGAISMHQDSDGERCQGNTNCVPLCPVQARYDARKTLAQALRTGHVDLITQAVASRVQFEAGSGSVTEIEVKVYESPQSSAFTTISAKGRIFILAANAVENARLMLASALQNNRPLNDRIGRNLMDHPYLLSWGLLPENAGVGRGPSCTSGLCAFRRGRFRRKQASFAVDIHNDGWGWATGSPGSDLIEVVDNMNKHGRALREELVRRISRQLLLAYMIEIPADPNNRVTVDTKYTDALGNMRPVVSFKLPDYSLAAAEFARKLSRQIFQRLGAEDYTRYDPGDYGYVSYNGQGYAIRGGNHLSGTHAMGTCPSNSVVNSDQRSWEHPNLYLVGPGSLPSIGSSNTTLTTAALCFKTAGAVIKHIGHLGASHTT